MKKIITMLLVVCLLCMGCGAAKQTSTVEDSKPAVEDTKEEEVVEQETATDSEEEQVADDVAEAEEPAEEADDSNEENFMGFDDDTIQELLQLPMDDPMYPWINDPRVVSIHENSAAEEIGSYFADQEYVLDRQDMLEHCATSSVVKKYEYTLEFRTFDFLTITAAEGMSLANTNLTKIGEKIKEEYTAENSDKTDVAVDQVNDYFCCYSLYVREPIPQPIPDGFVPTGDLVLAFHSETDPANGVTVAVIKDCSVRDIPFPWTPRVGP